jgi:hypothetical protein
MDASIKDLPPGIPSGNAYYRTDSLVGFHGIAFEARHGLYASLCRSFAKRGR